MYIPKAFEVTDKDKIFNFIKDNSFGILFSPDEAQPFATHLPFLLEEKSGKNSILTIHMAKANPHWNTLNNKEVLVGCFFRSTFIYFSYLVSRTECCFHVELRCCTYLWKSKNY